MSELETALTVRENPWFDRLVDSTWKLVVLGLVGGVGVAAIASQLAGTRSAGFTMAPVPAGTWQETVEVYAQPIEQLVGWPGFSDYLRAVAWTESRGDPRACAGACGPNAARGPYGLRPDSARVSEFGGPSLLYSWPWSTGLAAWYAARLRYYAYSGQVIDWLALRRGWALPSLVADVNETATVTGYAPGERSRDVRERFTQALDAVGIPRAFMYQRAFPSSYRWPGNPQDRQTMIPVLQATGAIGVA